MTVYLVFLQLWLKVGTQGRVSYISYMYRANTYDNFPFFFFHLFLPRDLLHWTLHVPPQNSSRPLCCCLLLNPHKGLTCSSFRRNSRGHTAAMGRAISFFRAYRYQATAAMREVISVSKLIHDH